MLQQSKRSLPPLNLEKVIPPVNEDEQPDLVQQYLQENNGNTADCILKIYLHYIPNVFKHTVN